MLTRCILPLLVATGTIVSGTCARADQDENLSRLESMPLEHRRSLVENLDRFDAMKAADREAVRALDRELAQQPEPDRARYLAVLRRYHLWLQRLPKERRDEINAAPPGARMALVTKFRAEELAPDARRRTPVFLQVVDLGDMSPFDVAQWLKIWFLLTPSEQKDFERLLRSPVSWRQRFLDKLDPSREIPPHQEQFTREEEEALVWKMLKERRDITFQLHPDILAVLKSGRNPEATGDPETRKSEQGPESRDRPPTGGRNVGGRMPFSTRRASLIHSLAGNYHFIEKPPEKVEPSNLFRFLATLPKVISESYTYLPPEEARRRLTILYRLIYPYPGEMPAAASTSNPPGASSKEAAGKAGPSSPQPAPGPSEAPPF